MRASLCYRLCIRSFTRPITITMGIVTGRRSMSGPPSAISAPPHRAMRSGTGHANSPQSVSDAIMREARGSLEMIKSRLAARSAAAKGHGEAHRVWTPPFVRSISH